MVSSGQHSLPGVDLPGAKLPPMSTPLIGAGDLLRLGAALPEDNIQKDDHLRPTRLRRSSASRNASSSGEHSLPGVELPGATPPPTSALLIGADAHLLLGAALPEENIQKDDHLRPTRLRRSSPDHQASSSGEHSLPGVELPGATPPPTSTPLFGADAVLR